MSFFSSITDAISDVAGVFTSAVDDVATFATDNLPLVVTAVAAYYGIPASAVGAAEIAGAEAAGAITASEAASAGFDLYGGLNAGVGAGAEAYGAAGGNVIGNALSSYRDPFFGEGSVLAGGGTVSPAATQGLFDQLSSFTGLSKDAISRLGGAAISSLAGLYGANKLGQASMDAANRLAGANQTATQLQSKMYEEQVARQQPFYQAGVNALPAYTKGVMPGGDLVRPFSLDDFLANKDPGQKYRTDMGLDAIQASAVSRGLGKSGKTYLDLMRAGQDYASQEYQNAYNRFGSDQATRRNALAGLTGFAPTAAQQLNASGANYAANVNDLGASTARNYGNADLTGAAARQSAYAGAGGAFANALSPNPYTAFLNRQMGVIG